MPPPPPPISAALKRKKWTEEEERTLINKYAEMQSDGVLAGNRTREKKFRPIAAHVNSHHHSIDPISFPFIWSWKDASTKVQNMRHQYLLVKQKLLLLSSSSHDQLDWSQGSSLWPNFLLYRDVFGDASLPPKLLLDPAASLPLGLGFECSDEDGGFDYKEAPCPLPPPPERRKKKRRRRREGREWGRVSLALAEMREREERLEERARLDWEEEVERRRRMEEEEREWEERMENRRAEWKKRMDGMMERHRAEMEEIRARVLQEQQAVVNQLIGIVSHFGGVGDVAAMGGGRGDGGGQYASQMMMGMVQVNGMAPGDNRVGGDGADDQFIVDA